MKRILAAMLWLTPLLYAAAQDTSAPKPNGGQAASATASATAAAKPNLKELLKGNAFTNSSGMAMVKISPALWAGRFEVTQEEYDKVMGSNPSEFHGARNPVDSVSWNEARS